MNPNVRIKNSSDAPYQAGRDQHTVHNMMQGLKPTTHDFSEP